MTDKEKIERIMLDKQLNNTQFSSMIDVTPGALSHITSGRTKPSITVLRNIKSTFPDINPLWLFSDDDSEPMYLTNKSGNESQKIDASNDGDAQPSAGDNSNDTPKTLFQNDLFGSAQPTPPRTSPTLRPSQPTPPEPKAELVNIEDIVRQSVAQTVDHIKQNQRRIIEVRVFFDDGTFETFGR